MMAMLEAMRDALKTITGVTSCKVGLEANISPADYPLIRVVPSRADAKHIDVCGNITRRRAEVLIYFGTTTLEADSGGLEQVYEDLFDLETEILGKMMPTPPSGILDFKYLETITDEDRLDAYKLMAIRCEVVG